MKWRLQPLEGWTGKATADRRSSGVFKATWPQTLKLLGQEIELIGGRADVVIEADVDAMDLRKDGMLRAGARVRGCGVVVSFTSQDGPMRMASDAYERFYRTYGALDGWQANVRAVALTLGALRSIDRWGVTAGHEQYQAFLALPAQASTFTSAEAALDWMHDYARSHLGLSTAAWEPKRLYRHMARIMHPDNAPPEMAVEWDRLDQARRMLGEEGLL